MNYEVLILPRAKKELSKLPTKTYDKIKRIIMIFSENPRPNRCAKLTGRNAWRFRVGDYRIIYEINDSNKTVIIIHVGHRRFIYKN